MRILVQETKSHLQNFLKKDEYYEEEYEKVKEFVNIAINRLNNIKRPAESKDIYEECRKEIYKVPKKALIDRRKKEEQQKKRDGFSGSLKFYRNKKVLMICVAVGLFTILFIFLFFKKQGKEEMSSTESVSESMTAQDTETQGETEIQTENETEIKADIDAVHEREGEAKGILYFTDSMETPLIALDEPVSIYVKSTSGDAVLREDVTKIFFGLYNYAEEEMRQYNNAEVLVSGAFWEESGSVYIDVKELKGEPTVAITEAVSEETEELETMTEKPEIRQVDTLNWVEALEKESAAEGYTLEESLMLDPYASGEYKNNLDPDTYYYYWADIYDGTEIEDFSFVYPPDLFCEVYATEPVLSWGIDQGTLLFLDNKMDTELYYSLLQRTDGLSTQELKDMIFSEEMGKLSDGMELVNTMNDGYGKIIVTGWADASHSRTVYELIKIVDNHIMQMKIETDQARTESGRQRKNYVTECLYRLCGFSNTDKPVRSFSDFVEGKNG